MPPRVVTLVTQLTENAATPYLRTRAIFDFFSHGQRLQLQPTATKSGDSGSDLDDFLLATGPASASSTRPRWASCCAWPACPVPGRARLHPPKPDKNGTFSVTTIDAHAWVEAYFAGIGWIPFDPTPLVGVEAARSAACRGRRTPTRRCPMPPTRRRRAPPRTRRAEPSARRSPPAGKTRFSARSSGLPLWAVWLIIAVARLIVRRPGVAAGGCAHLAAGVRGFGPQRMDLIRSGRSSPTPRSTSATSGRRCAARDRSCVAREKAYRTTPITRSNTRRRSRGGAIRRPGPDGHDGADRHGRGPQARRGLAALAPHRWERTRARMLPDSLSWVRRVQWRRNH